MSRHAPLALLLLTLLHPTASAQFSIDLGNNGNGGRADELTDLNAQVQFVQNGMRLSRIEPNTLTRKLGLEPGDLILWVNGRPLGSVVEFHDLIFKSPNIVNYVFGIRTERGNIEFTAEIWRDGDHLYARDPLQVIRRPGTPEFSENVQLNQVVNLESLDVRARVERQGLRITSIGFQGIGRAIGLQQNDLITLINGQPAFSPEQVRALIFDTPGAVSYINGYRTTAAGQQAFLATARRIGPTLTEYRPLEMFNTANTAGNIRLPTLGGEVSITGAGIRVTAVDRGSVADQMGAQVGDLIRTINGKTITSLDEFQQAIQQSPYAVYYISGLRRGHWFEEPTIAIAATLRRSDDRYEVVQPIQVYYGPTIPGTTPGGPRPVNVPELGASFATESGGLRLKALTRGGVADRSGLEVEDLIQAVNGRPVASIDQLRQAVLQSASVISFVTGVRPSRGNQPFLLTLRRNQNQVQTAQAGLEWQNRPGMQGFRPGLNVGQRVSIPLLGVDAQVEQDGLRVVNIQGGMAQALRLQVGDLLEQLNGRAVYESEDFRTTLVQSPSETNYLQGRRRTQFGEQMFVGEILKRNNQLSILKPVELLDSRPTFEAPIPGGLLVLFDEIGAQVRVEKEGMRIVRVMPQGVAQAMNLHNGDLVQSVNGRPSHSPQDFREAIAQSASVESFVAGLRSSSENQPFFAVLRKNGNRLEVVRPAE